MTRLAAPLSRIAGLGLVALLAAACGGDSAPERPAAAAPFDPAPWLAEGQTIQQATFAALSGELQGAMADGGVAEALRYCNTAAYPLTDSLSAAYGAEIRRATLQPRNPANRATPREAEVLLAYAAQRAEGRELAPLVHELDDSTVAYYAPIPVQPLCLNCHGTVGAEVTPAAAALIAELYPGDEALGYAEGDLRGIWSLVFRR